MAQWFNLYTQPWSWIHIKNPSFTTFLIGFHKASHCTFACLKLSQPLLACNKKIVQFKCGKIAGQPLFGRNEKLHNAFSRRKYSTYPGSFIRRKEILILIVAGKEPGLKFKLDCWLDKVWGLDLTPTLRLDSGA